ncbi:acyl-CoA dehydrogenase/oxidase C-terminal [Hysterangium stoloniferum]|nr:acyl-CoA dehydrogenase/oxidase C-terminal [Hysterangium stoloniferum]
MPNRQIELMEKARSTATFSPRQLAHIIYGSEEAVKARENAFSRLESTLSLSDSSKLPTMYGEMDRTSLYHEGLRFGKAIMDENVRHPDGPFKFATHRYSLINTSPFGIHELMFKTTLTLQADEEQLANWMPLASSGRIIGAYCQTELGHGTFLRGLETTATFDRVTDEFVIHSPTTSSTKYWPGGLGFSSSHAIVMARLIIDAKDYGVHPFMVQLRSLEDFKPIPGLELGDIGLKFGMNSGDNGYAVFNHVRIPRRHLLMRNCFVSKDGTYTKNENSHNKHAYATMVYTRVGIIYAVAFQLAQAATIAIRYSVVREQGNLTFDSNNSKEATIMSFKSQQYRLLTLMSRAFAILFAHRPCHSHYEDLVSRQKQGDNSTLAYAHATSAGLKAYASQTAADGSEDARKCCGGHGYSALSGFPEIVTTVSSIPTLEGENYVMYQQTARYLMKCAAAIRRGEKVDQEMAYLVDGYQELLSAPSSRCPSEGDAFFNPDVQLSIFRHRAVRLISECETLLNHSLTQERLSFSDAWNRHMMGLICAARAHIEYYVLEGFVRAVSQIQDAPIRNALKQLCDLFALTTIESPFSIGAIGFFEDSYISPNQLRTIRSLVNVSLSKLVPEAVALTDAWNFSDASLQSALGQKDGNVYERMLSWTRQLPINQGSTKTGGVEAEGFSKYTRPILQAKL